VPDAGAGFGRGQPCRRVPAAFAALLVLCLGGVGALRPIWPGASDGRGASPDRVAADGSGSGESTLAGAAGCERARRVPAERQRALVRGVRPPLLDGTGPPAGPEAQATRQLLLSSNRYAVRTLYPTRWAAGAAPLDDVTQHRGGVRAASAEAFALAVSTETSAFDAAVVGRSRDFTRGVAVWLVRSLGCGHAAVREGGWGAGDNPVTPDLHEWQSSLWAMQAGAAGWLLWPYLGPTDRYRVAAMVMNEADRLTAVDPQYQGTPSGRVLRPGDTKAEEDAWTGTILALAAVMFPNHPHRLAWRRQEVRFALAAYATRADTTDDRLVHGAPLRSWLDGWNLRPDGTVVNHGIVNPAYASSIAQNTTSVAVHGLGGVPAPRAALHNVDLVYGSLLDHRFPAQPYAAPGGTVYRPGSGDIYLPQGNDWGTRAAMSQFVRLDAAARVLGIRPEAAEFQRRHAGVLAAMQARSADGRSFQSRAEQRYVAPEELDAENIAQAWLMEWAAGNGRLQVTDDDLRARPTVAAADASGRAWTRYPIDTAPRPRAPQPAVLAPVPGRRGPAPMPPAAAATRRSGSIVVTAASHGLGIGIDVLVPRPGTPGYLLHIPPGGRATVTRLADGKRTCTIPAPGPRPGVLVRAPATCFDAAPILDPTLVTTLDSGPSGPLVLAVTAP
jgi:hypothetical protein